MCHYAQQKDVLATSRLCLARNKSFNFTAKHWGFSPSLRTPLGKLFNNEGLRFERCKRTRTLNEAFEVQVIGFNPSDRQTHQKAHWRFCLFPSFSLPCCSLPYFIFQISLSTLTLSPSLPSSPLYLLYLPSLSLLPVLPLFKSSLSILLFHSPSFALPLLHFP